MKNLCAIPYETILQSEASGKNLRRIPQPLSQVKRAWKMSKNHKYLLFGVQGIGVVWNQMENVAGDEMEAEVKQGSIRTLL